MQLPTPVPGLVLRYAYLWNSESEAGREEASKDRPAAIVLVSEVAADDGGPTVTVVPITHSPPRVGQVSLEIPGATAARLGLDHERHWVVLDEVNRFAWPGPDLRPVPGSNPPEIVYGLLSPKFFDVMVQEFLKSVSVKRAAINFRDE